jgi:hypothetical protein
LLSKSGNQKPQYRFLRCAASRTKLSKRTARDRAKLVSRSKRIANG